MNMNDALRSATPFAWLGSPIDFDDSGVWTVYAYDEIRTIVGEGVDQDKNMARSKARKVAESKGYEVQEPNDLYEVTR